MIATWVADNMVLAMFVDADRVPLLSALAGGSIFVAPSIVDPEEVPPFAQQPTAEFARGAFSFQQRLGRPLDAVRLQRRVAFYSDIGNSWQSIKLSLEELLLTEEFLDSATWQKATAIIPSLNVKWIGRGEAECAAVAVTRGWTLWSDDAAMIRLLAALYPSHPVERISDLLSRAVGEEFIPCETAADLYNDVFVGRLGLWTTLQLDCQDDQLVMR